MGAVNPAENGTLPHVGYLNHAYSALSTAPASHSRPGSVIDLNFDKLSHKSSRWGDEDDEWDPHFHNDSGLHSLAVSCSDSLSNVLFNLRTVDHACKIRARGQNWFDVNRATVRLFWLDLVVVSSELLVNVTMSPSSTARITTP